MKEAIATVSQHSPSSDPLADFGANEWLVDEMYDQYLKDKNSVDASCQTYFAAHPNGANGSGTETAVASPPTKPVAATPAPAPSKAPEPSTPAAPTQRTESPESAVTPQP